MRNLLRWTRLVMVAALGVAGLSSCDTTEHVLLLDIHAQAPVTELRVFLSSLDSPRPRFQSMPITVPMGDRDISVEPVRVAIEVGGPADVTAHVVGILASGEMVVGTRCYNLAAESVIEDAIVLVGPLGALDADADGFLPMPEGACQELGDSGFRNCEPGDEYLCTADLITDCDDANGSIFPGATGTCEDGIDDNCDGVDEVCGDNDGDTFRSCAPGVTDNCDCDDGNRTINPDAAEVCGDAIDQNCDGFDEFCDNDGDGVRSDMDCDDNNPDVAPGKTETPGGVCDGLDNNCNGLIDEVPECVPADLDGDGVDACEPGATDTSGCDCNDCDTGIFGGSAARERCYPKLDSMLGNGLDDDCDGMVDETCLEMDMDGDGELAPRDCDDTDPLTLPQTGDWLERCTDTTDQNCVIGSQASACAGDSDMDGWAEPDTCEGDASVNPDVAETCNNVDDNCNGIADEVLVLGSMLGCARGEPIVFADDFQNCGGCRLFCNPRTADACVVDPALGTPGFGTCDCTMEAGSIGECMAGDDPFCCPETGCQDLATDVNNCGGCGRVCGEGESCVAGRCSCGGDSGAGADDPGGAVAACPDPDSREINVCCGGTTCTDTSLPDNCGGCGFRCGPNSDCQEGSCQCDAPGAARFEDCNDDRRTNPANDGCEIDTLSNLSNCGACGINCSPNNSTGVCTGGSCQIADCSGSFEDCDGSVANGCEANLQTDVADCGGCDNVCDLTRTNRHTCNAGNCRVDTCDNNFGNCDATDSNGCEVDLRNTTEHCGTCGNNCGENASCVSGACQCDGQRLDCGGSQGCETSFGTSDCGNCNVTCGPREDCDSGGRCTCDGTSAGGAGAGRRCTGGGGTECCPGSGCQRLNDSEAHCGACDTSCGTGETCSGRACTCGPDSAADGTGEVCDGGSPDCCPSSGGCTNTNNDMLNCGGCGNVCNTTRADGCNGSCQCDGGAECGGGQTCCGDGCQNINGNDNDNCGGCGMTCSGTCLSGSCCTAGSGCVDGSSCVTSPRNDACGNDGNSCVDCSAMSAVCVANACQTCDPADDDGCGGGTPQCLPDGSACVECFEDMQCGGGVCVSNSCQTCDPGDGSGCGASEVCLPDGSACVECNTPADCGGDQCVSNVCQVCNPSGNAGCGGGTPLCLPDGSGCVECNVDGDCGSDQCVSNVCLTCDPTDGAGCTGGLVCLMDGSGCVECEDTDDCDANETCITATNTCCAGCVDGTTCRTGDTDMHCGSGGVVCDDCMGMPSCVDTGGGVFMCM